MYDTSIVRENLEDIQISAGFAGRTLTTTPQSKIIGGMRSCMNREGMSMFMPSCMSF